MRHEGWSIHREFLDLDYFCLVVDHCPQVRGEFMRATRVLATRPDRAIIALAELCEERKDEDLISPPPFAPRLPPQTPYSVGSQSLRPKGGPSPERLSPPTQFYEPGPRLSVQQVSARPPPEHMAPRRGKWTSPPPPEAPPADHTLFENQLGMGLELATASTDAREREAAYNSSSSNSEILTDEDPSDNAESDDVRSVQSFTESTASSPTGSFRKPSWHTQDSAVRITQAQPALSINILPRPNLGGRGRFPRLPENSADVPLNDVPPSSAKGEFPRRSISGPPRALKGSSWSSSTPIAINIPLPPSPESPVNPQFTESSTIFYQTGVARSPRPTVSYPTPASHSSLLSQYHMQDFFSSNHLPSVMTNAHRSAAVLAEDTAGRSSAGPDTPKPASHHSHSHSTTTITANTPPPHTTKFSQCVINSSPLTSTRRQSRSRSQSPSPNTHPEKQFIFQTRDSTSPQASASNGSSPAPSSTGYATSLSRSPSPSPSPPPTATPPKQKDELASDRSLSPTSKTDGEPVQLEVMGPQADPGAPGNVVSIGDADSRQLSLDLEEP